MGETAPQQAGITLRQAACSSAVSGSMDVQQIQPFVPQCVSPSLTSPSPCLKSNVARDGRAGLGGRHERAEALIKASGVRVDHVAGDRAYYSLKDRVVQPERSQFPSQDAYTHTALRGRRNCCTRTRCTPAAARSSRAWCRDW